MTRDRIDYENGNVYTWKKAPFYSGWSRKFSTKKTRVNFYDYESESASDSSPESSQLMDIDRSGNKQDLNQGTHGFNKKK